MHVNVLKRFCTRDGKLARFTPGDMPGIRCWSVLKGSTLLFLVWSDEISGVEERRERLNWIRDYKKGETR
jgi:hypothetical protein